MPNTPKFNFSIATLLWLMVCVAMLFGGWFARDPQIEFERAKAQQERAMAELATAEAQALAEEQQSIAQNLITQRVHDQERARLDHAMVSASVVVEVSAGDVVAVVSDWQLTHVRIAGINCPKPYQPLGKKAEQFTHEFCMKRSVTLIGDEWDGQDRIRADVVVDGKSLREALLQSGLAWQDGKTGDDSVLSRLEEEARAAKVGIWASPDSKPLQGGLE